MDILENQTNLISKHHSIDLWSSDIIFDKVPDTHHQEILNHFNQHQTLANFNKNIPGIFIEKLNFVSFAFKLADFNNTSLITLDSGIITMIKGKISIIDESAIFTHGKSLDKCGKNTHHHYYITYKN